MKIINNGIEKNIEILKHFKLDTDEYILYKDNEQIGIGYINNDKITVPNSEKMESIKKIIGNFISSNPSDLINSQYKCVTLSNNIDYSLEEVSVQHIKLTEEQIANLTHKKDLSNYTYRPMYGNYKEKRETSIGSLIIVFILIIIVAYFGVQLKDKIKGEKPKSTKKEKTTVKVLKPEEAYTKALNYELKGDADGMMTLISSTMKKQYNKYITKAVFTYGTKQLKEELGDKIKLTSEIKSNKIEDSTLEELNLDFHETVGYNVTLNECYNYTGTVKLTGSKGEKVYTPDTTMYCKINDEWGFVFDNIETNILLFTTVIPEQSKTKTSKQETKNETTKTETKKTKEVTALENSFKVMATGDYNKFLNLFPKSMREYIKKHISESNFKSGISNMFNEVGTDITVTSNLTTAKKDNDWMEKNNEFLAKEIGPNVKATECYEYKGSVTIKGSKGEKVLTEKDLNETWYCKINGEWGFIFG